MSNNPAAEGNVFAAHGASGITAANNGAQEPQAVPSEVPSGARRGPRAARGSINLAALREVFLLPRAAAAARLGISVNCLKRSCRRVGISRWPYRKLNSLRKLVATNGGTGKRGKQDSDDEDDDNEAEPNPISQTALAELQRILENPDSKVNDETQQIRNTMYRRAYLQSSRQGKGSKAGRGSSSTPDPDSDDSAEGADKVEQPKEKPKRKGRAASMSAAATAVGSSDPAPLRVQHVQPSNAAAAAANAFAASFPGGAQAPSATAGPGTPGSNKTAVPAALGTSGRAMSGGLGPTHTGSFPTSPSGLGSGGSRQTFMPQAAANPNPLRASTGQVPAHGNNLHRMLIKKEQEALRQAGVMGIHQALAGAADPADPLDLHLLGTVQPSSFGLDPLLDTPPQLEEQINALAAFAQKGSATGSTAAPQGLMMMPSSGSATGMPADGIARITGAPRATSASHNGSNNHLRQNVLISDAGIAPASARPYSLQDMPGNQNVAPDKLAELCESLLAGGPVLRTSGPGLGASSSGPTSSGGSGADGSGGTGLHSAGSPAIRMGPGAHVLSPRADALNQQSVTVHFTAGQFTSTTTMLVGGRTFPQSALDASGSLVDVTEHQKQAMQQLQQVHLGGHNGNSGAGRGANDDPRGSWSGGGGEGSGSAKPGPSGGMLVPNMTFAPPAYANQQHQHQQLMMARGSNGGASYAGSASGSPHLPLFAAQANNNTNTNGGAGGSASRHRHPPADPFTSGNWSTTLGPAGGLTGAVGDGQNNMDVSCELPLPTLPASAAQGPASAATGLPSLPSANLWGTGPPALSLPDLKGLMDVDEFCMMCDLEDAQNGVAGPGLLDVPGSPPSWQKLALADLGALWDL